MTLACQSDLATCDPENLSTDDIAIVQRTDATHGHTLVATAKLGMFGEVKMMTPVKFNESIHEAADRLANDFRVRALELGFLLE